LELHEPWCWALISPLPPPWPAFVTHAPLLKVVLFAANAPPATPKDMVSASMSAVINNVMRLRICSSLTFVVRMVTYLLPTETGRAQITQMQYLLQLSLRTSEKTYSTHSGE